MADQNNPGDIFDSIKTKIPPQKYKEIVEKCPKCGLWANLVGPPVIEGEITIATYECPNEHRFAKEVDLK